MNIGPIIPSNYVNNPNYQAEMNQKRPQPRIRPENRWIKEVSEAGSIGVLIELQSLQTKLENLRVIERDKAIRSNRGEYSSSVKIDRKLNKSYKENELSKQEDSSTSSDKDISKKNIENIKRSHHANDNKCKKKIKDTNKRRLKCPDSKERLEDNCKAKNIYGEKKSKKEDGECINRINDYYQENRNHKEMKKECKYQNRTVGGTHTNDILKNNKKEMENNWNKDTKIVNTYEKVCLFKNEPSRRSLSGCKDYLRSHTATGPPLEVERYPPIQKLNLTNEKRIHALVPTALSAKMIKLKRRHIDFVKANAYALDSGWYKNKLRRGGSIKEGSLSSDEGITKTNKIKLISSSEQKEMIKKLTYDLQKWYEELNHLPISMDTLRIKTKKKLIEERIKEVEESIDLFRRGTVFIEQ